MGQTAKALYLLSRILIINIAMFSNALQELYFS